MEKVSDISTKSKYVDFMAAALRGLDGKPWGVNVTFKCPMCGGRAKALRSVRKGNPRGWKVEEIIIAALAFKCSLSWLVTDHRGELREEL